MHLIPSGFVLNVPEVVVRSLQHLRHHPNPPGMNICHASFDLRFEITSTQMDILQFLTIER
jgi:hypothetical protein